MDAYYDKRRFYQDASGSVNIAVAGVTQTLKAVRNASYTIYVQKVRVRVTTGAAGKTWDIKDTAGTPVSLSGVLDVTAVGSFELDFGPEGKPLTAGKDLQAVLSAAGGIGIISWDAYQRLTSTIAAGAGLD